jgi:23S rRNA pseudouridine2604 synthase
MEKVRVSKLMSEQGICSRREADSYIERGWVLVDGEPVTELGTRAYPNQKITLAKAAQSRQEASVTILLNKPMGYVSAQPEKGYLPAVSLVTAASRFGGDRSPLRFSGAHLRGLAPAGRLDIDSTGLLVLTQDGRIAKQLIGEDSGMEKEYLVRVQGRLGANGLALLSFGLSLDGVPLKRADVRWQNKDQLLFILREGKKRQIRRMCEQVDLQVTGLKRVRIGNVRLGDLPAGQWRYLRSDERF